MKEINETYFERKLEPKRIENLIEPGERILWKGCPKKGAYAIESSFKKMPIGLLWGIIDVAIIITVLKSADAFFALFIILFSAIHMIPFWAWLFILLKSSRELKNTEYYITNYRVIEKKGHFGYINTSIPLEEITDTALKRGLVDRIVKAGDIYITGKKGALVMFDIPNCDFIYNKLTVLSKSIGNSSMFYVNNHICEHCGSYYDSNVNKCPNCGAPNTVYKNTDIKSNKQG